VVTSLIIGVLEVAVPSEDEAAADSWAAIKAIEDS